MSKKYQGTIVYFFIKPLLQSFTSVDFWVFFNTVSSKIPQKDFYKGYTYIFFFQKNVLDQKIFFDQNYYFVKEFQWKWIHRLYGFLSLIKKIKKGKDASKSHVQHTAAASFLGLLQITNMVLCCRL